MGRVGRTLAVRLQERVLEGENWKLGIENCDPG